MPPGGRGRGGGAVQSRSQRPQRPEEDEVACREDRDFDEEYTAVEGDEYAEVDEEYAEADEDEEDEEKADREQQILQEACLSVSGPPLPPSAEPPKDADEYLRQVQWERLHCPETVSVEIEESTLRKNKKRAGGGPLTGRGGGGGGLLALFIAPEVPEELRHNEDWADDVAEAFRAMRSLCGKAKEAAMSGNPSQLNYEEWRRHVDRDRPSFELLAAQDHVSVNHLVVVSVDRLQAVFDGFAAQSAEPGGGYATAGPTDDVKEDPQQPSSAGLDPERLDAIVEWGYASLAFVEEPLVDEMQHQLQRLRRACQRLLVLMHERGGTEMLSDGAFGMSPQELGAVRTRICLLLVLVVNVFGQR
ncbi:unnamed protein product [Polarella glacialis]|uniref:Uncharacterized protein n=1 Tax=Polarella glacialis TaxID=89957 RepID=A0A813HCX1_POLGL|nr:unnamed protein product [Polarella glacialis]